MANEMTPYDGGNSDDENFITKWTTKGRLIQALIVGGILLGLASFAKLFVSIMPDPTDLVGAILAAVMMLVAAGGLSFLAYQRKAISLWIRAKAMGSEERIIGSDPIGIMKAQLMEIRTALTKSENSMTKLESAKVILGTEITANKKELEEKLALAKEYEDNQQSSKAISAAQLANLAEEAILDFQPQYDSVVAAQAFLSKLIDGWKGDLAYLQSLIKKYERKMQILGSVAGAVGTMDELTGEGSEGRRIFNIATEQAQKQMADKIANIKLFMNKNKSWIEAKDDQAVIQNMKGKKLLQSYLKDSKIESLTGLEKGTQELEKVLAASSLSKSADIAKKKFDDLN